MCLSLNRRVQTRDPVWSPRRNSSTFVDGSWNARPSSPGVEPFLPSGRGINVVFTGSVVRFKGLVGTRVTYEERFARYEIHSTWSALGRQDLSDTKDVARPTNGATLNFKEAPLISCPERFVIKAYYQMIKLLWKYSSIFSANLQKVMNVVSCKSHDRNSQVSSLTRVYLRFHAKAIPPTFMPATRVLKKKFVFREAS